MQSEPSSRWVVSLTTIQTELCCWLPGRNTAILPGVQLARGSWRATNRTDEAFPLAEMGIDSLMSPRAPKPPSMGIP